MFKLYHEEVRPSQVDYHRYKALQRQVSNGASPSNYYNQNASDARLMVPIALLIGVEPPKQDILEETLNKSYQVSEKQEEEFPSPGGV